MSPAPLVSVVLSTLGERPGSLRALVGDLAVQDHPALELIVVLQADDARRAALEDEIAMVRGDLTIRWCVSATRGVLTSRNLGVAAAAGELLLLADDDCRYAPDAIARVVRAADEHEQFDVVTFVADRAPGEPRNPKNRHPAPREHGVRSLMHVCTIEVMLRRRALTPARLPLFDERFGLGTPFDTGGENIMLLDLMRSGARLGSVPDAIVLHPGASGITGARLERYAFAKGAMFRRMFGVAGVLPTLAFVLRHMLPTRPWRFGVADLGRGLRGFVAAPTGPRPAPSSRER